MSSITFEKALAYTVAICFICLLNAGHAQTQQEEAQRKQRIELLKKGVIRVTALKGRDVTEVGAGIMIGELEGVSYVLTAYHIVEDAKQIFIESYGESGKRFEASVFDDRYDPNHDIAVLTVSSYKMSRNSLEQLYETSPDKLQNNRIIILGHPPDKEWHLVWTNLHSKNSTRLFLPKGVVEPANSGGPVLDIFGNLIGVVIGTSGTGLGEAVRIDTALSILDKWRVPYRTKLRVDFRAVIQRIIESSLKDFDDMKGVKTEDARFNAVYWDLLDRSFDITGRGRSMLVRNFRVSSGEKTVYVAYFDKQGSDVEGRRVWNQIAQQVRDCLPKERLREEGDSCLVVSYRKKWYQDPIQFIVHLTVGNEIELIMYRGYVMPYGICSGGTEYILDQHRLWNRKR